MKRLTFVLAVFATPLLFAGCGQSGPLYVPGNPTQMAVPPSQDASAENTEEEDTAESSEKE